MADPEHDARCDECGHIFTAREMAAEDEQAWGHPCHGTKRKAPTCCESHRSPVLVNLPIASSEWRAWAQALLGPQLFDKTDAELRAALADRWDQTLQAARACHVELIWRVVTGDGAQLENLAMSDDEWDALRVEGGDAREHFPITLRCEDWMAMVRIARGLVK